MSENPQAMSIDEEGLATFENLARTRRSTRHFQPTPLPEGILERLLDCARWAPSGYNIQPLHVVVIDDPAIKERLAHAAMDQPQVMEAPIVTLFCGDARVHLNNFEEMIALDKEAGAINAEYEAKLRKFVPLAFQKGPLGLNWLWKAMLPPFLRPFTRIPELPAVYTRRWLNKQVALGAMNFMLAAHAAGLATVPMEGYDERRVRATLHLPRHIVPVVMIPVGYDRDGGRHVKTRLPLERMIHRNGW